MYSFKDGEFDSLLPPTLKKKKKKKEINQSRC